MTLFFIVGISVYDLANLCTSQYCLPSVRLSAISHLGVIYVKTHDSIGCVC